MAVAASVESRPLVERAGDARAAAACRGAVPMGDKHAEHC